MLKYSRVQLLPETSLTPKVVVDQLLHSTLWQEYFQCFTTENLIISDDLKYLMHLMAPSDMLYKRNSQVANYVNTVGILWFNESKVNYNKQLAVTYLWYRFRNSPFQAIISPWVFLYLIYVSQSHLATGEVARLIEQQSILPLTQSTFDMLQQANIKFNFDYNEDVALTRVMDAALRLSSCDNLISIANEIIDTLEHLTDKTRFEQVTLILSHNLQLPRVLTQLIVTYVFYCHCSSSDSRLWRENS